MRQINNRAEFDRNVIKDMLKPHAKEYDFHETNRNFDSIND